jgi:L-alanine-DL-glutamate epimerase-like enolase superfamily enzyme
VLGGTSLLHDSDPGLSIHTLRLPLRDPFRIARTGEGSAEMSTTLIVERKDADGLLGLGEAVPEPYYGETPGTIAAVLPILNTAVSDLQSGAGGPGEVRAFLDRASRTMDEVLGRNGAAKCGIDIALHDLAAKRLGLPLFALLGTGPVCPPTDISLGIDTPERVAERARRMRHFPALKIKMGGEADVETLEAVRDVYSGPIRIDANCGWQRQFAERMLPVVTRVGVELIEQPFGPRDYATMGWLQERSGVPIVADESVFTEEDLPPLVGEVAGINVKLAKCGGIAAALRLITRAHELGFKVMIGCVGETSVGIAAAAALGSLVDWVDLDSSLLTVREPFEGLVLDDECRWHLPDEAGLGVRRREHAA